MNIKTLEMLNLSLGKWFTIPIQLHWSLVVFFVFIILVDLIQAITCAGLFFIILLHELGHGLAGIFVKMRVSKIELSFLGGFTAMELDEDPMKELIISLAGPLTNFILFFPLYFVSIENKVMTSLYVGNLMLFIINIIPVCPLDGGRILKSGYLCWRQKFKWHK